MIMRDDDIDIERAANDPVYRRKVIALLNRESVEPAAVDEPPETASEIAVE